MSFDDAKVLIEFDQGPPSSFNVLLYGPTGSGKSTAAASSPGPILWVNAEGRNALAFPKRVAAERGVAVHEVAIRRNISPRPILRNVIEHLRSGVEPRVATVVIDTVAKVRDGLIRDMVSPGAKNTMQQFGEVAKVLEDFVVLMRDLPVNVVLLCHEDISDVDSERIIRPLIGGALTEKIPSEMDIVAYCGVWKDETGTSQYLGQLVEGRGRRAKDRSGGALGQTRALDLSEWLGVYREALTPEGWEDPEPDEQISVAPLLVPPI